MVFMSHFSLRNISLFSALLTAVVTTSPTTVTAESMTLAACVERALAHNNLVLMAEQGVVRSQADVTSARARRLPSLSTTLLNFSRSRTGPSVRVQENPTGEVDPTTGDRIFAEETTRIPGIDRNTYSFGAGLNHTIYDGGQGRRVHGAAREGLTSAQLQLRSSHANIVFLVKARYYSLLKAQDLVQVQASAQGLSQRRLEGAEARLEVGAGTRVDVLRLQVAVDNASADMINSAQQVLLASATLNHAMGRDLSESLEIESQAEDVSSAYLPSGEDIGDARARIHELVQQAKQQSPDIQALRHALTAAELNLKASQAAWQPTVSASVSYSRNNEVFDRVYGGLDENYRINGGLSVNYNLFDGGLRTAANRRARANLEMARLTLDQRERDLALAVETTYLEMVRLGRILEIALRTTDLATEDLRLAEERYRVGKGRLLEVLDAQVGQTQAASNRVRTRYDLAVAGADMERLVGK